MDEDKKVNGRKSEWKKEEREKSERFLNDIFLKHGINNKRKKI